MAISLLKFDIFGVTCQDLSDIIIALTLRVLRYKIKIVVMVDIQFPHHGSIKTYCVIQ